jgi:hypothetical protein
LERIEHPAKLAHPLGCSARQRAFVFPHLSCDPMGQIFDLPLFSGMVNDVCLV